MSSAEYIMAVYDVEKRNPGVQYPTLEEDGFPLHVTLTPPASGLVHRDAVIDSFRAVGETMSPFVLPRSGPENFGTELRPFYVERFARLPEIIGLHVALLDALETLGLDYDRTFTEYGRGYNPHSTRMASRRLEGDSLYVDAVTVVHRRGDDLILSERLPLGHRQ